MTAETINIHEKLRALAQWLGWNERTRSPIMNKRLSPMFSTPWGITASRESLAFYMEAAIEKKAREEGGEAPWIDVSGGSASYLYWKKGNNPAVETLTEVHVCDYDEADPRSKVNAIIEAAWQVAQMCASA
jgi:hypothetical protein